MGLSIGGLGSGLDTQSIISQLMAAEAGPQNTLKAALSTNTVKAGAWTSLTTIVAGLQGKADALTAAGGLTATSVTTNAATARDTRARSAIGISAGAPGLCGAVRVELP